MATTRRLWRSSLEEAKGLLRPLFTQERVALSAALFLEGLLGPERQEGLRPIERLNTGLFIHRDDQSIFRGIQVKPYDISGFGNELRVGTHTPAALPTQAYAFFAQ